MSDVLLGPLLGLFSLGLYRRVARQPLGIGLAYLGWLSFLFASLVTGVLAFVWLPASDRFVDWLGARLPEMHLTPDGVVTEAPQPVVLTHPELGTVLVVDTSKEMPGPEDIAGTHFFVSRTHLAANDAARGETRVIALTGENPALRNWTGTTVNGRLVHEVYRPLRAFAGPVVFLGCVVVFFVWKLLAALVYSAAGVALNRLRTSPLPYRGILNVTIFAMTSVIVLQGVALLSGGGSFRVSWPAGWLITLAYLAAALLRREPPPEPAGARS